MVLGEGVNDKSEFSVCTVAELQDDARQERSKKAEEKT
jgi:hypothetical protein